MTTLQKGSGKGSIWLCSTTQPMGIHLGSIQTTGSATTSLSAIGILDFISAIFFGFTSGENPLQLFYPETPSELINFPTGMIPLFLVPYAIFYHTLSLLNHWKHAGAFDYETDMRKSEVTKLDPSPSDNMQRDMEEGLNEDVE